MFPLHEPLDEITRESLKSYDDLTAALLARRGIRTKSDADKFLNPSYDEHLHDPLLMTDMQKAAERFAKAVETGEHICVWSDYDCDGVPGAVLLHDFLKKVGANFENYIPHRHLEGYGMNVAGVEKLAARGVKLIVTVDSGITDVGPVARANELGVEVIVTDHHLPGDELPPAFAVVNPNARADEPYPFHALCGSGVAWKLVCATIAVSKVIRERVPLGWEKWLLDMVGIATIADMVSLTGENRVLASYGLKVLRKSPRLGLQKMCRVMRVEQRAITEDDVGFMIAPRVNAASRMGEARDVFELLTTHDEVEADRLAKEIEKANRQRKAAAGAITRAVHTKLKESTIGSVIVLGDPEWRPSLLGLVANSIAEEYERPVFLWGREGNMSLKGSVRSGGAVHVLELMRATENVFVEFGGHAASGGFTVRDDAVFNLEAALIGAHKTISKNENASGGGRADTLVSLNELTPELLHTLNQLAPFGIDNPKPVFLLRDVAVRNVSRFGKASEHVKLALESEFGMRMEGVAFFAKKNLARVTDQLHSGSRANLAAHLERDTFSRGNPLRLRLLDIRVS